jgi:dTDP-4-amino-4,6-dideoxygalactose transaminase
LKLPYEPSWSKAVYHLYVVQVDNREELQRDLAQEGIGTAIHYPIPLHLQTAYSRSGYKAGDFPITEAAAGRIVSLPMFPSLGLDQQRRVAEQLLRLTTTKAGRSLAFAAGA